MGLRSRSAPGALPAEVRLSVLRAGARDALWEWDLDTGAVRFTERWKRELGYGADEFPDRVEEWFRRVHPRDLDGLKRDLERCAAGEIDGLEHEFRMLHKDGTWRRFLVRGVRHPEHAFLGGSFTDVTAERGVQGRLLHEVLHDPMTGLANRGLFLDRLELALLRRARRGGPPLAVLYLDLARFHNVNDSLGVDAGDRLLNEVALRLKRRLRPGDTLARLGGDKFGLLLDGVASAREALRFAAEIHRDLGQPMDLEGHEVCARAAIGIALSGDDSGRAPELLRDAITAMHRAKEDGASPWEVFDPEMNARAKDRLRLEGDLRRALKAEEFVLHYQPIVALDTGRIAAFEALVRWRHPERGLVRPDTFVPLAEDTGLIVPLGRWVLGEACRQLVAWRRALGEDSRLQVAVNLSAHQFRDPDLVSDVVRVLEETRLPPASLELEVTESVLMERNDENTRTLRELRDAGVRLSIDDFGTGYSSLACLNSFPLHQLKIDRSFVMGMEFEAEKAAIVDTILALAATLGLEVVAEGIETADALSLLRERGCERGQGFYFSNAIEGRAAQELASAPPSW